MEERFWAKVRKTDECWEWTAARHPFGHGHIKVQGKVVNAHRLSYEMQNGPIPDGLVVDHICRNPGCVRPDHMELVGPVENVMRGEGYMATNARKTHCPQGHEYTPDNTYIWRTARYCRTCQRQRDRARRS